jgi:hypothetical protein
MGAAMGAPVGGVGAVPGAVAGLGIGTTVVPLVDAAVNTINGLMGTEHRTMTEAFSDFFTKIGVPDPQSETAQLIEAVARGAAEAGGSASLGKTLAQYGATPLIKGVGQMLGQQPGVQVAGGAGAEAGMELAEQAGAGPGGQLAAGIAGDVITSGVAGIPEAVSTMRAPIQNVLANMADDVGITLTTTDVLQPKTSFGKLARSLGEKIPFFGTGRVRAAQAGQRVDAVRDLLRQYDAADIANLSDDVLGPIAEDLIRTRSNKLEILSKEKAKVIADLAGEAVPTTKTAQAIDDEVARWSATGVAEAQPIIEKLTNWRTAIENQDLSTLEDIRKVVGEAYKSKDLSGVSTQAQSSFSKIYAPLREDMGDYIKQAGGDDVFNIWKNANDEISGEIAELADATFKRVLNKGEANPETVRNLLFSRDPSSVNRLYNELSETGRSRAQTAIMSKVAEESRQRGTLETLSPEKFIESIRKRASQQGVFFNEQDLDRMNGLAKVLEATRQAPQAGALPRTGEQLLGVIAPLGAGSALTSVFGSGVEGFAAALGLTGATGLAANIYESKPVRDILLKIGQSDVSAPVELFKRLSEITKAARQIEE